MCQSLRVLAGLASDGHQQNKRPLAGCERSARRRCRALVNASCERFLLWPYVPARPPIITRPDVMGSVCQTRAVLGTSVSPYETFFTSPLLIRYPEPGSASLGVVPEARSEGVEPEARSGRWRAPKTKRVALRACGYRAFGLLPGTARPQRLRAELLGPDAHQASATCKARLRAANGPPTRERMQGTRSTACGAVHALSARSASSRAPMRQAATSPWSVTPIRFASCGALRLHGAAGGHGNGPGRSAG